VAILARPSKAAQATAAAGSRRLPLPSAVDSRRISWRYAGTLLAYHLIALLAFLPWFFSWTGVILAIGGIYVFGVLGMTIGYHRLLAHRGFACPKWVEHGLALLGACCLQDAPARWVAAHRRHHHHADEPDDPHSPLVSFFWGHVGWLLVANPDLDRIGAYGSYAKDIVRDPFYKALERGYFAIILLSWLIFFATGYAGELIAGGAPMAAARTGASILVWGVFVRTVAVWHITWTVNSLAHLWGYRNYATDEASRNNWFVAVITSGEGWHNNHHADPRSAKHGHRWWELDLSYLIVRLLGLLGLARQIAMPRPSLAAAPTAPIFTRERIDHGDD
jgi:stearoyl-CoA desaturase (delta-9 desaturase)